MILSRQKLFTIAIALASRRARAIQLDSKLKWFHFSLSFFIPLLFDFIFYFRFFCFYRKITSYLRIIYAHIKLFVLRHWRVSNFHLIKQNEKEKKKKIILDYMHINSHIKYSDSCYRLMYAPRALNLRATDCVIFIAQSWACRIENDIFFFFCKYFPRHFFSSIN